jgi:hypothetical protein
MCRIFSESLLLESMRIDLSRVRSQYFFTAVPCFFAACAEAAMRQTVLVMSAFVAGIDVLKSTRINDMDSPDGANRLLDTG